MTNDYIRIGRVLRPQGIRGELKLALLTENPSRFDGLKRVFLERKGKHEVFAVASAAVRGENAYLTLIGIDDRDAAETLRDAYVCLRREDAPLPEGRYFIDDMIGCEVALSNGQAIGTLAEILQHGAADVYVIRGKRPVMFPALKTLLQSIDVGNKRIVLDAEVFDQVAVFDE